MISIVKESTITNNGNTSAVEPIKITTPTIPTTDKRSEVTISVYNNSSNRPQNNNKPKNGE